MSVTASFDVHGADLRGLIVNARAIATQLVGGPEYTIEVMTISQAVPAVGDLSADDPRRWIAEVGIEIPTQGPL